MCNTSKYVITQIYLRRVIFVFFLIVDGFVKVVSQLPSVRTVSFDVNGEEILFEQNCWDSKKSEFDLKNTHTVYFIQYIKKIIIPISFAPKKCKMNLSQNTLIRFSWTG